MMPSLFLGALLAVASPPPVATPPPAADEGAIIVQGKPYGPCGPPFAPVYVAPMGEPFRTNGISDPMAHWFAAADADHDGRLTPAELTADAARFFATIDKDHDGELDPQEVSDYEINVAPEIRLYRFGSFNRPQGRKARKQDRRAARERADYGVAYGAGQYASLNIPEPVASADLDIDRAVSRDEFAQVAASRFALLDTAGRGYLTYDTLPRSPAQQAIDACRAQETKTSR